MDAFRIDTVAWMNQPFWTYFTREMKEYAAARGKPAFFQFGEYWTNGYGQPFVDLQAKTDMSLLDMPSSAMGGFGPLNGVFKGGSYSNVRSMLESNDPRWKDPAYLVTFLDNHDKPRFNDRNSPQEGPSVEQYRDALNWYFTSRGIPVIYYGTEIRMEGPNADPGNRRYLGNRMDRNAPLYGHLAFLNRLRKSSPALQKGKQNWLQAGQDTAIFTRVYGRHTAIVALNKGSSAVVQTLTKVPRGRFRDAVTGEPVEIKAALRLEVPAHGLRVFLSEQNDADQKAPVLTLVSPVAEGPFEGTVRIEATATDENGVSRVELLVDGESMGELTEGANGAYTMDWASSSVPNGAHVLRVVATDYYGNESSRELRIRTQNKETVRRIHYLRPDWNDVDIHFNNGGGWTKPPGMKMTKVAPGHFVFEIVSPVGTREVQICFHKHGAGNEHFNWDSRGGKNYVVTQAEVTIRDGAIEATQSR